ncbi:unnamed protein product [Alopecurus aequalis]
MGVVVKKSSLLVVRPPEPLTTTAITNLSPYDKQVMSMPVTMFLVFDRPIHEPAQTIERTLSKALVHYLPMSGRVDAAGLSITRTGEGVSFVAATASCALEDVKFFPQLVDELAIYYPEEYCGVDDPLLMMQVTEFSCGGFVMGVTWNHVIADAAGMGQFLQAVGELARGLSSPSVVPVRLDDLLTGVPPSIDGFAELMTSLQPIEMAVLDITVPSRIIKSIKDEYRVYSKGSLPCSTFEAVTAVLWQCRTRAIALSNPEEESVAICITVNARKYVAARDGYYGNCVTGSLVVATGDAVANGPLMDVVEMIQRAKSQIADQYNKGAAVEHVGSLVGYNLFVVSCWRNLGLEEVDFGGGRPVRVTSYIPERFRLPVCLPCLPCQGTDGGSNVLSACVTKEHAGAFLGELSARFN